MTDIVTIGIDLAKNVFAVHGVDATGKSVLLRPSVPSCLNSSPCCHHVSLVWRRALAPITGLANSRGSATPYA